MPSLQHSDTFFSTLRLKIQELSGQAAARIEPDDALLASGLIDSMMVLDLIAFVEAQWLIAVDPMDLSADNFGSMRGIQRYVHDKLEASA